ncbi:hypothetical protein [Luedemannella helvata]|uniref:Uncharacterized protein n=1 Tax=Luedemannella helvata TaxID=349315 RepID=A0ABP4WDU3_9ACTN
MDANHELRSGVPGVADYRRAPATAYLSLIADGEAHRLYRRYGFTDTAPASIGMYRPRDWLR